MDIFSDTTTSNSIDLLEIDRFKAKILDIWGRMLQEHYANHYDEDPEEKTELDLLMDMLDGLMDEDEELESVQSDGKAPTYGGKQLSSHNESSKTEKTNYKYSHKSTKTPSESSSRIQSGLYEGTPSSRISKKKTDTVVTKYAPLIKEIQEEIRSLTDRQRIGRRKMRFRL